LSWCAFLCQLDEEARLGDIVEIKQSRPISRHKHHILYRIIKPYPVFDWNAPAPEPFTYKTVPETPDKDPFPWITFNKHKASDSELNNEEPPVLEQSVEQTQTTEQMQDSATTEKSERVKGYSKSELARRRKREEEAALKKSLFDNFDEKKKSTYARK
jgi:hypothetical protein